MNDEENIPILMRFIYKRHPAGSEVRVPLVEPLDALHVSEPEYPTKSRYIYALYRSTGRRRFTYGPQGYWAQEYEYQGIVVSG